MKKIKEGLAFHVHHNKDIEYCYDYGKRVCVIKETKPKNEQEIRLRLFKILSKEALKDIPVRMQKAYAEWQKISAEYQKAYAEWQKAYVKRQNASVFTIKWQKAYAEWQKAYAEYQKAYAEWGKISAEYQKTWAEWGTEDREVFHKKWCGCKEWNGTEIIFNNK